MFVFYDWPFPHMCALQRMQPISLLILGSVFSDCVVFYGVTHKSSIGPLSSSDNKLVTGD